MNKHMRGFKAVAFYGAATLSITIKNETLIIMTLDIAKMSVIYV